MARHPFLDHDGPIPFVHRGGALEAFENTVAAFEQCRSAGFTYFETDVRATADGVLLSFHDATLSRVTDRDGRLVGIVAQADVARDVDSDRGERRVAHTLERISEPGRGGREAQRASQSRSEAVSGSGTQASGNTDTSNEGFGTGGNENA